MDYQTWIKSSDLKSSSKELSTRTAREEAILRKVSLLRIMVRKDVFSNWVAKDPWLTVMFPPEGGTME
jgi:hypothetical protein